MLETSGRPHHFTAPHLVASGRKIGRIHSLVPTSCNIPLKQAIVESFFTETAGKQQGQYPQKRLELLVLRASLTSRSIRSRESDVFVRIDFWRSELLSDGNSGCDSVSGTASHGESTYSAEAEGRQQAKVPGAD